MDEMASLRYRTVPNLSKMTTWLDSTESLQLRLRISLCSLPMECLESMSCPVPPRPPLDARHMTTLSFSKGISNGSIVLQGTFELFECYSYG